MASYTNRRGERVEVSDSHIETAIELKLELQKQSPSGKTSWATHRRMMQEEGFDDSSTNENYRQMIKQQQNKRGQLPKVEEYADMVSDKKLDSVKNALGEMYIAKRGTQNANRELNKMKRDIADGMMFFEGVIEAIKEKDFSLPSDFYNHVYSKGEKSKDMIASFGDLHYGALVNVEGRLYNLEIAEKLVMDYADKLIDIAIENNVEEIYVVNIGDLVEGVYMRTANAYGSERNFSEQVVDASELVIKFLTKLSKSVKVAYAGFNGNHDRISSKNDNLYGDGAVSISNKIIKTFAEYSDGDAVRYIESDPYHHIVEKNGRSFLFVHGDTTPLKKETILAEQSALYNIPFDAIIGGHVHHFSMKEAFEDRFIVTFGSIKGNDEYTLKTIRASASRSQGVILIDDDGEFEIRKVKL